ncbi:MAG: ATP-binding protein, partial [Lachnospiraceae bacterium]|nr:ATP-binding protein [Lachnospiraceae bacterium]
VNAVLNHYMHRAFADDIKCDWEIDLAEDVNISVIDMCSVVGNILENAILACEEVPQTERFIDFLLRTEEGGQISITTTNSFSGNVRMKDGEYRSTRRNGSGIGLKSIASTAERYGGIARFSHEGNEFYTDVMFG